MNSKIITRLRVLLNLFHKIINFIFKIIITITPPELRKNNRTELELKIENNLAEETFNYFREDFNLYSKIKVDEYDGKYAQSVEGFYTSN